MATYRVKEGCKAFINSALRYEGYEFDVDGGYKVVPEWLEEVKEQKASRPAQKPRPVPKEPVTFIDADLAETPTVQL